MIREAIVEAMDLPIPLLHFRYWRNGNYLLSGSAIRGTIVVDTSHIELALPIRGQAYQPGVKVMMDKYIPEEGARVVAHYHFKTKTGYVTTIYEDSEAAFSTTYRRAA